MELITAKVITDFEEVDIVAMVVRSTTRTGDMTRTMISFDPS